MNDKSRERLVEQAIDELSQKSHVQIETETAWKWASRAIASYMLASQEANANDALETFAEAEDYAREAVEHAASAEPGLVREIQSWVSRYATEAKKILAGRMS